MKILITLLLFFINFQSFSQDCPKSVLLEKTAFKEKIKPNDIQLIDVRTPDEFKEGCIEKAINADVLKEEHFKNEMKAFNTENPVYIYCRSGRRSQRAAQLLCEMGFTKVYDLKGGYLAWQRK